jgi:RES domain-containing protein
LNALPLDGTKLVCWRLDRTSRAAEWDSGKGASIAPGRWNVEKHAVVYASLDAALCLLEKAVHASFDTMNVVPHSITRFEIFDIASLKIVMPDEIPNPNWLRPISNNRGQQEFCAAMLKDSAKPFVLVPSVISPTSWNLLFDPIVAKGQYALVSQERYGLDTRLVPKP